MTGDPDVIGLLQRADWTRLSLSATVSDGSTVLVAPGRRFREQTADGVRGCDGDRAWMLPLQSEDGTMPPAGWPGGLLGPEPPLRTLLCPSWLLRSSRLEVRGPVRACGRDGLDVIVTGRESSQDVFREARFRIGRTEAVVDAELGILLRVSSTDGRPESELTELVSLDVNPVIDAAIFEPPPGSTIKESPREDLVTDSPFFLVWKTAAGLAAGAVGAWTRYSPFGHGRPAGVAAEEAMPQEGPAPEVSQDGRPSGPAVGDDVLHLLYGSGTSAFAATAHEWSDIPGIMSQGLQTVRRTGLGGLGLLLSALSEQIPVTHDVSFVRVGGPGRYQVDHAHDRRGRAKTMASDGQRRWLVYRDKVTVGPARPLPPDVADLADASWLLECRLSGGTLVMAGDRPAYRVNVARGDAPWGFSVMFSPAVAVVDAELGILLSLTSYLGGKPIRRSELRDISGGDGDFLVRIPAGLPVEEEPAPSPPLTGPVTPLALAGGVAREVGSQAVRAARDFLRRMGIT